VIVVSVIPFVRPAPSITLVPATPHKSMDGNPTQLLKTYHSGAVSKVKNTHRNKNKILETQFGHTK